MASKKTNTSTSTGTNINIDIDISFSIPTYHLRQPHQPIAIRNPDTPADPKSKTKMSHDNHFEDEEALQRLIAESAAMAQQSEEDEIERALALSRAAHEEHASSSFSSDLAAALAASPEQAPSLEDEQAQMNRLLQQSMQEFHSSQIAGGAVADNDEGIMQQVLMRSQRDYHAFTHEHAAVGDTWTHHPGMAMAGGAGEAGPSEQRQGQSFYAQQSQSSFQARQSMMRAMGNVNLGGGDSARGQQAGHAQTGASMPQLPAPQAAPVAGPAGSHAQSARAPTKRSGTPAQTTRAAASTSRAPPPAPVRIPTPNLEIPSGSAFTSPHPSRTSNSRSASRAPTPHPAAGGMAPAPAIPTSVVVPPTPNMPNPLASAAGADPPASSRHQLVGHGRPPAQGTSAALSSPSPHSQPSDPLERSRKLAAFRAKQQEEYAKSLAADRERARKKREEEQALAAALRLKAQADADAMQAAEREAAQEREVEKAEAKEESEEDEEEEPDDPRFRKERHLAFLNRFAKPE